jgi:hypothetical protein
MKLGRSSLADAHDTFLADSSSCNEDRSGRATPTGEKSSFGPLLDSSKPNAADLFRTQPVLRSASEIEDEDGWIITPTAEQKQKPRRESAGKARRVWLEPTSSEENLDRTLAPLSLPREGSSVGGSSMEKASPISLSAQTPLSADDVFHSATSLPVVQVESRESVDVPALVEQSDEPTEADRERAFKLYSNDDASVHRDQVATLLGDMSPASTRVRKAYLELFDWTGLSILAAMRDLCGKLVLKAETQQVDRILMTFSDRWCECNANHGFKSTGRQFCPCNLRIC